MVSLVSQHHNNLLVQNSGLRSYNTTMDYLHETNASIFSYTIPSHCIYRVDLRNVHSFTLHSEINFALAELRQSAKSYTKLEAKTISIFAILYGHSFVKK